jgi:hypothetical protein
LEFVLAAIFRSLAGTGGERATPAMLEPHAAPPEQGGGAAQFTRLEAPRLEPRPLHCRPEALPHLDHALELPQEVLAKVVD